MMAPSNPSLKFAPSGRWDALNERPVERAPDSTLTVIYRDIPCSVLLLCS